MYLISIPTVSTVIRSIIQRMDAYTEVMEYMTFNHSLSNLIMSVFRTIAPAEFLYRISPSYSQQTYKHRLSSKREKFLENYALSTISTISSTKSVKSMLSLHNTGVSSTPNLHSQQLHVESSPSLQSCRGSYKNNISSTSYVFLDGESNKVHGKSMGSLRQYGQSNNYSSAIKDRHDIRFSFKYINNMTFPYPLCLLPLPFKYTNSEVNQEQGTLYSVLPIHQSHKKSTPTLHSFKEDWIDPEVLKKRNPIVKYEVNVHIHERYILLCMIHVQRPVMSILNSKTVYTLSDELNYLGVLNLLFSILDFILSNFFSSKLCLHKLKVDTKAYYVYTDLSSHATAMFKEQIEPVYPVDVDVVNRSITKSKGICLQTILTFATMASYFARSVGLECTSTVVYTRTVMGFFGFGNHTFGMVNPGLSLLNGLLSNFYEIACDASGTPEVLKTSIKKTSQVQNKGSCTRNESLSNDSGNCASVEHATNLTEITAPDVGPATARSATATVIRPSIPRPRSRYNSFKQHTHRARSTKRMDSKQSNKAQERSQPINTDNRIFFVNQVTGYNSVFSTKDFFTDIPEDIFIPELIATDKFIHILQSHPTAKSPHHSLYELLPPCYNLLPLPYKLCCSTQSLLRGAKHDIICEHSCFFEVLPRPEIVYILVKLLIYSLAYDVQATHPYAIEEVFNTANYKSLCENNKVACFADVALSILQDPMLLNFMSLDSYLQSMTVQPNDNRQGYKVENTKSPSPPPIHFQDQSMSTMKDAVFSQLFPKVPELVFLPGVLLSNSPCQQLVDVVTLPSSGFLAPYTRNAMRKAITKGMIINQTNNNDNRNAINRRSENNLLSLNESEGDDENIGTDCFKEHNTLRILHMSSDPNLVFDMQKSGTGGQNLDINVNKRSTLIDRISESTSSFYKTKSSKGSEKELVGPATRRGKSRMSLVKFPSLTFTTRNMGNLLHINPLHVFPLPKPKLKDNTAIINQHTQLGRDQLVEMQVCSSDDASSLIQFQGTCYSTMSRNLNIFSDILKNLSNFQALDYVYDIVFNPANDDYLMFYGMANNIKNINPFPGKMNAHEYYRNILNAQTVTEESRKRYMDEMYDEMFILFPEANEIVPRDVLLMNTKPLIRQISRSAKKFHLDNKSRSLEMQQSQLSESTKSDPKPNIHLSETTTVTSEETLPMGTYIIDLSDEDSVIPNYKRQRWRSSAHNTANFKASSRPSTLARVKAKSNLMKDIPHSVIVSGSKVSSAEFYDPKHLEKSASRANLTSSSSQIFAFGNITAISNTSSGYETTRHQDDCCHSDLITPSPVPEIFGQDVVIRDLHLLSSVPPSESVLPDLYRSNIDIINESDLSEETVDGKLCYTPLHPRDTKPSEVVHVDVVQNSTDALVTDSYAQSVSIDKISTSTPIIIEQTLDPMDTINSSSEEMSLSISSSIVSGQNNGRIKTFIVLRDNQGCETSNLTSSPLEKNIVVNTSCCENVYSSENLTDIIYDEGNTTSGATTLDQEATTILSMTCRRADESTTGTTSTPYLNNITHLATSSNYRSVSSSDEDTDGRRYTQSIESDDDIDSAVAIMDLSRIDDITFSPSPVFDSNVHTHLELQLDGTYSTFDFQESSGHSPFMNVKPFLKRNNTDTQNSIELVQASTESTLEAHTFSSCFDQSDHHNYILAAKHTSNTKTHVIFADISKILSEDTSSREGSLPQEKLQLSTNLVKRVLLSWLFYIKKYWKRLISMLKGHISISISEDTESCIDEKSSKSTKNLSKLELNTPRQMTKNAFDSVPYLNNLFEKLQNSLMLLPVFSFVLYKGTKECASLLRLSGPNVSMPSVLFQANVLLFLIQFLIFVISDRANDVFKWAYNYVPDLAPISVKVLTQELHKPVRSLMVLFLRLTIRVTTLLDHKIPWAPLHKVHDLIQTTSERLLVSMTLSHSSEGVDLWMLFQFVTGKCMSVSALRVVYLLIFLPTVYLIFMYYDKHVEKCQTCRKITPLDLILYGFLMFINAYYIELLLNVQAIRVVRLKKLMNMCRSEIESMKGISQPVIHTDFQLFCIDNSLNMHGMLTKTILDLFLILLGVMTYWFILSSVVTVPPLLLSINNLIICVCSLCMKLSIFREAPYTMILQAVLCFSIFKYIRPFLISFVLIMKAKVSILLNWYQSQRVFQVLISDHMFALLIKSLRVHENLSILKDEEGRINNEIAKDLGIQYYTMSNDSSENNTSRVPGIYKRYKPLPINSCGFIAQIHTSVRGSVIDSTSYLFDTYLGHRTISRRYFLYKTWDFICESFNRKIFQPAKLYAYGIGLLSELKDPLPRFTIPGLSFYGSNDTLNLGNTYFNQQFPENRHNTILSTGTSKQIDDEINNWKACHAAYFYDSTLKVSSLSSGHPSSKSSSTQTSLSCMTLEDLINYWKHKRKDARQLRSELKSLFAATDEFVRGYTSYNDKRTLGMRRYAEVSPNSICMVISFSDLFPADNSVKWGSQESPDTSYCPDFPFRTQTNEAFYLSSIQFQIIREFMEILYLYITRFGRHLVVTSATFYRIEIHTKCDITAISNETVDNILSYINNTQINLKSLFKSARTILPVAMKTLNNKYLKRIYNKERSFISQSSISSMNTTSERHRQTLDSNNKLFSESTTISMDESAAGIFNDNNDGNDDSEVVHMNIKYTKEDLYAAICLSDLLTLSEYMRNYFVNRARKVLPQAYISIGIAHGLCIETILGNHGRPFCVHGAAVSKARYIAECVQPNNIGISDAAESIHVKLKNILERLISHDSYNLDKIKEKLTGKNPTIASMMSAYSLMMAHSRTCMKESYGYSVGE